MRTIHHNAEIIPARYIPAYDEHVYEYSELSEDAKSTALSEWVDTCDNISRFNSDLDEIINAVKDFTGYVGADWTIDSWHNIAFCFTYEIEYATYSDNGFYASIDIADEWNRHVDRMLELYAAYQDADDGKAEYKALMSEVCAALDDVRRVTQRNINDSWDYWVYDPADAFKNVCDSYGYEFDEDGNLYAA